ncbi:MAG: hypothetical protein KKE77_01745 [Alphaproteobacteria bacterium]|nr:hypothetical protein [Alphaproteobacteria bacterium]
MTAGPRPTNSEAAGLVAGFALWSLAFLALYGGHGTLCAFEAEGGTDARAVLLGIWTTILIAQAALILWFARRWRASPAELRFIRLVSLVLAIAAMAATVWTGLPVATLTLC